MDLAEDNHVEFPNYGDGYIFYCLRPSNLHRKDIILNNMLFTINLLCHCQESGPKQMARPLLEANPKVKGAKDG